jgi:hypothetical protein
MAYLRRQWIATDTTLLLRLHVLLVDDLLLLLRCQAVLGHAAVVLLHGGSTAAVCVDRVVGRVAGFFALGPVRVVAGWFRGIEA